MVGSILPAGAIMPTVSPFFRVGGVKTEEKVVVGILYL